MSSTDSAEASPNAKFPEKSPLPPTVLRFGWIAFFTDVGTEMAYPLLPAFLIALGGGARALGVMEGLAESVSAAVKWWSGSRSDRAGARKPFVVLGYGSASFIRPALALAQTPLPPPLPPQRVRTLP